MSQSDPSGSAVAPVSAIVLHPISRAASAARKTFFDFPLVLIAINTSPACARPATCARKHLFVTEIVAHRRQR